MVQLRLFFTDLQKFLDGPQADFLHAHFCMIARRRMSTCFIISVVSHTETGMPFESSMIVQPCSVGFRQVIDTPAEEMASYNRSEDEGETKNFLRTSI